jgi:hypothetical protein
MQYASKFSHNLHLSPDIHLNVISHFTPSMLEFVRSQSGGQAAHYEREEAAVRHAREGGPV